MLKNLRYRLRYDPLLPPAPPFADACFVPPTRRAELPPPPPPAPPENSAEQLGQWRAQWAHLVNRHLQRHGHAVRVDHRSLKEQGIEREATIHLGYAAQEIDRRGGQSDRMEGLQAILARNEIRLNLKALDAEVEARELAEAQPVRKARRVADRATGVASGVGGF